MFRTTSSKLHQKLECQPKKAKTDNVSQTFSPTGVQTLSMMKTSDGLYINSMKQHQSTILVCT
jgi:hypothetical protein